MDILHLDWKRNHSLSPFEFRMVLENNSPIASSMSSEDADADAPAPSSSGLFIVQQRLRNSLHTAFRVDRSLQKCDTTFQGMDNTLHALKLAMDPLQSKSSLMKELESRVDRAIGPALAVLRIFDSVHELKRVVSAGPRSDVGRYLEYISRLEDTIGFLSENSPKVVRRLQEAVQYLERIGVLDKFRFHKFNETLVALKTLQAGKEHTRLDGGLLIVAFEHLETEFRRILTEYGVAVHLPAYAISNAETSKPASPPPPLPAPVVQILQEIVEKLAKNGRVKNCLEIYEDVRSWKVGESLRTLHADYLRYSTPEAIDNLNWGTLEEHIALWTQHIEVLVKVLLASEKSLCRQIFSKVDDGLWGDCFGKLSLKAGLAVFIKFGNAFAQSQKEPQKLFKLLDMFDALQSLRPILDEIFRDDWCDEIRQQVRELQKKVVHGACTVFWEFGLQVELQKEGSAPTDGGVLKRANYVVNYIKRLVSDFYQPIIAQVLQIEQSWRGGSIDQDADHLALAILHIMESLQRNVEACCKALTDPALARLSLMNNHWYIYTRCKSTKLGALLGDAWLRQHKQRVEKLALEYQKEAWGPVLQKLSKEGLVGSSSSSGSNKEAVRQRVRNFHAAFEDIFVRHSSWYIPDPELRSQIGLAVVQSVLQAYNSYLQNFRALLQHPGGAVSMELQYSPEDIEHMIDHLFLPEKSDSSKKFLGLH